MILLIDNYDSFSYNVYQLAAAICSDVKVIRNDELTVEEIEGLAPCRIILSPGPGKPSDAGICEEVIRHFAGKLPILGICLGHQAICEVFGASVTYAKRLMHGKQSVVTLDTESALFRGMPEEITVARYHSLAASPYTMPECLKITSRTLEGEIMAVKHREYPIYGVQFHPESVLTPQGYEIMANFLRQGEAALEENTAVKKAAPQDRMEEGTECGGKETETGKAEEETLKTEGAGAGAGKMKTESVEAEKVKTEGTEAEKTETGKTEAEKLKTGKAVSGRQERKVIEEAIVRLTKKQDIGYEMSKAVMNEIMGGEATDVQKSAYLVALSMKGETIEEITGSAEAMRSHAIPVNHGMEEVLEIVGTGGDGSNSFNISTTASLIISAAGVPVAKHGNRAASSKSGAADCLEALGVNISPEPKKEVELLQNAGICFLFAQKYHTAMKYVGPVRRELGIRTIFNILGPLSNPAKATLQIMGVYDEGMLEPMARVLSNLGVRKGMVVYGQERLDEISICGPTSVCCFKDGQFKMDTITPEAVGLRRGRQGDLLGGTPQENAAITRAIMEGTERGAKRDAAVINAAAALLVAGKARSLQAAVKLAEDTIDSGRALAKLEQFIALSNE